MSVSSDLARFGPRNDRVLDEPSLDPTSHTPPALYLGFPTSDSLEKETKNERVRSLESAVWFLSLSSPPLFTWFALTNRSMNLIQFHLLHPEPLEGSSES